MYGVAIWGFVEFFKELEKAQEAASEWETRGHEVIIFEVVDSRGVELTDGLEWGD